MAQSARHIPGEHQPLCESCGYILEGLPTDSKCPECGKPVAESTDPAVRVPPLWERSRGPATFAATSLHILFRPSHFFRHLETRRKDGASMFFAIVWLAVCSLLLTLTALGHAQWLESRGAFGSGFGIDYVPKWTIILYAFLRVFVIPVIAISLFVITRVAARLTAWEAAYRGLRLPLWVVQRGLDYHSVHLLPVCLLALATVYGYQLLLGNGTLTRGAGDVAYIWTLCAEVIICAGYLFFTYWAAMRNMLFANK